MSSSYDVRASYGSLSTSCNSRSPSPFLLRHSRDGNSRDGAGDLPAIVQHLLRQLAEEYSRLQEENKALQDQVKQMQESLGVPSDISERSEDQPLSPQFMQPRSRASSKSSASMMNMNHMSSLQTFNVSGQSVSSVSPSCSFASSVQSHTQSYGQHSTSSNRRHLDVSAAIQSALMLPAIPSANPSANPSPKTSVRSEFLDSRASKADESIMQPSARKSARIDNAENRRSEKKKSGRGKLGYRRSQSAPCALDMVTEEMRRCSSGSSLPQDSAGTASAETVKMFASPMSKIIKTITNNLPSLSRAGTLRSVGDGSLSLQSVMAAVPVGRDQTGETVKRKPTLKQPRLPSYFCPEDNSSIPTDRHHDVSTYDAPSAGVGILAPYGNARFWWDIAVCLCLFVDCWVTLFILTFGSNFDLPSAIVAVDYLATAFFIIDIAVNFRTGRLDNGRLVMDATTIAQRYLFSWFLLDLVATIPWNFFLPKIMCFTSLLRVAKIPSLKSLEYFWILKGPGRHRFAFLLHSIIVVLMSLMLVAHIHACLWEVAKRLDNLADKHANFDEALKDYYDDFWWAFTAFMVGSRTAQRPWIMTLEIIIATERLIYFMLAAFWGAFHMMVLFKDPARMVSATTDVLSYARQHKVCPLTQLQVSYAMHEVVHGRGARESFYGLLGLLPVELRQKIDGEMWNESILSLEIFARISSWDARFLPRLLTLIGEDVMPAQSVLCWEGDSQNKAWRILSGRVTMESTQIRIKDFIEGMWIGENALVNPYLHSSGTMSTKTFTVLMFVPVNEFHKLLDTLGISSEFKEECVKYLWRGFCGRCGRFGDHFMQDCPTAKIKSERFAENHSDRAQNYGNVMKIASLRSNSVRELGADYIMHRDLQEFLYCSELEHLRPVLVKLKISDLDQLEAAIQSADVKLTEELTALEYDCLNLQAIDDFRKNAAAEVREKIELMVPKKCLMFLSHYKVEAGTEAALMRAELQALIERDSNKFGRHFEVPVFLDSENLNDLNALQQHVINSHNLILLLTKGVLLRPWVLVEMFTAARNGIPIIPMKIEKPEIGFEFPDDAFYANLLNGSLLDKDAMRVLTDCNVDLSSLEKTFRIVFKRIALRYSPHRSASIRQAELESLLRELTMSRRKS